MHAKSRVGMRVGVILIVAALAVILLAIYLLTLRGDGTSESPISEETVEVYSLDRSLWEGSIASLVSDESARMQEGIAERLAQEKALEAANALATAAEKLNLTKDLRSSFVHGEKPAQFQKYIVLHDTEGSSSAQSVVNWWDSNGQGVAAHFVINKDGSILQCVEMDSIAHHAGFGDTGHNALFAVGDESRDDKVGTTSIGSWAADYGMNSYSIGIELVHVGGEGDYPQAQLDALDSLIAYIDSYYGFESQIIDHKDWRSGNSDTSPEFLPYFNNYKAYRQHSLN